MVVLALELALAVFAMTLGAVLTFAVFVFGFRAFLGAAFVAVASLRDRGQDVESCGAECHGHEGGTGEVHKISFLKVVFPMIRHAGQVCDTICSGLGA